MPYSNTFAGTRFKVETNAYITPLTYRWVCLRGRLILACQ